MASPAKIREALIKIFSKLENLEKGPFVSKEAKDLAERSKKQITQPNMFSADDLDQPAPLSGKPYTEHVPLERDAPANVQPLTGLPATPTSPAKELSIEEILLGERSFDPRGMPLSDVIPVPPRQGPEQLSLQKRPLDIAEKRQTVEYPAGTFVDAEGNLSLASKSTLPDDPIGPMIPAQPRTSIGSKESTPITVNQYTGMPEPQGTGTDVFTGTTNDELLGLSSDAPWNKISARKSAKDLIKQEDEALLSPNIDPDTGKLIKLNRFIREATEQLDEKAPNKYSSTKVTDPKEIKQLKKQLDKAKKDAAYLEKNAEYALGKSVHDTAPDRTSEDLSREVMEEVTGPSDHIVKQQRVSPGKETISDPETQDVMENLDKFMTEEADQIEKIKQVLNEQGIGRVQAGSPTDLPRVQNQAEVMNVATDVISFKQFDEMSKRVFDKIEDLERTLIMPSKSKKGSDFKKTTRWDDTPLFTPKKATDPSATTDTGNLTGIIAGSTDVQQSGIGEARKELMKIKALVSQAAARARKAYEKNDFKTVRKSLDELTKFEDQLTGSMTGSQGQFFPFGTSSGPNLQPSAVKNKFKQELVKRNKRNKTEKKSPMIGHNNPPAETNFTYESGFDPSKTKQPPGVKYTDEPVRPYSENELLNAIFREMGKKGMID
jgi:Mg2+ and Co2+ transporter CorA